MPLLDHFRPPLRRERHWEGFHSFWTSEIVRQLNRSILPANYVAEPTVKVGVEVEVDVAALEEGNGALRTRDNGVATLVYAPPQPALTFAADFAGAETFEIKVQKEEGGLTLVAAIELISPGNKDRPATRAAFVRKCATYLQEGVSVIIVDIVTERSANLHTELLKTLQAPGSQAAAGPLYAVVYRNHSDIDTPRIQVWPYPLEIGSLLPTVPLWLGPELAVPVDLEQTYQASCEALRIQIAS